MAMASFRQQEQFKYRTRLGMLAMIRQTIPNLCLSVGYRWNEDRTLERNFEELEHYIRADWEVQKLRYPKKPRSKKE